MRIKNAGSPPLPCQNGHRKREILFQNEQEARVLRPDGTEDIIYESEEPRRKRYFDSEILPIGAA